MAGATEIDASWRNSHADGHYSSRMRTMAWILVLILLFGTGVIGITNGDEPRPLYERYVTISLLHINRLEPLGTSKHAGDGATG